MFCLFTVPEWYKTWIPQLYRM